MSHLLRGTFQTPDQANAAIDRLAAIGYGPNDITVVMSPQTRERLGLHDTLDGTHVGRTATGGAVLGGLAAIVATAVTGGAALPIIAGALAGLAGGSAIGALVGAAGSEQERKQIEKDVEGGAIIVAVQAKHEDEARVQQILQSGGADTAAYATVPGATTRLGADPNSVI
jgi:hypothetical protein